MEQVIDTRLSTELELIIERNRDYNRQYQAQVYTGTTTGTEYLGLFDFGLYSGATMEVRTRYNDFNYVLRFSTDDGSIVLGSNGLFTFNKTAAELNIRSGEYLYDMYLRGNGYTKRAFLRGPFTVKDTVTK